jgi:hypothetical protein
MKPDAEWWIFPKKVDTVKHKVSTSGFHTQRERYPRVECLRCRI